MLRKMATFIIISLSLLVGCKVNNENINPFSIAHYLTDNYTRGNLTKEQIENATSSEISEAVYYNNLNYFPLLNDGNEIERN